MAQALEDEVRPVRGAKLWPITVEAYHILGDAGAIPENTELLYGLVYKKMPKSPLHSFLVRRLFELLQKLNLPGFFVRSEQPLTFADSEPEPDIAIVEGANENYRSEHPKTARLVMEVCVSSLEYDRSKLRAYAAADVKECWLIMADEKQIEVHSGPSHGKFVKTQRFGLDDKATSEALSSLAIDLDELFGK